MTRNEHEAYDEEVQDVLGGLRQLAREVETPPELLPQILARGAQILSPPPLASSSRPEIQISWWQRLNLIWRHPLVVGPVTAAVCFVAGIWSAPYLQSAAGRSSQIAVQTADMAPSKPSSAPVRTIASSAPAVPSTSSEAAPVLSLSAFDKSPSESAKSLLEHDRRYRPERRSASAHYEDKEGSMPVRPAMRMAASAQRALIGARSLQEVTLSLPTQLYEQVQRESRQRDMSLAEMLREAIEAYLRNQSLTPAAVSEPSSQSR